MAATTGTSRFAVASFMFPFTPRADVRLFSTNPFGLIGAVQLRDSVAPTTGNTIYRDLVYAGADTIAFLRSDDPGYTNTSHLAVVHDPTFGMSGLPNVEEIAAEVGTPYFLRKPFGADQAATIVKRALTERRVPQPR